MLEKLPKKIQKNKKFFYKKSFSIVYLCRDKACLVLINK